MAIDYSKYLSADQKKAIINDALTRLAVEAYQNDLAAKAAEANDENPAQFVANIAVIETVIASHEAELEQLA